MSQALVIQGRLEEAVALLEDLAGSDSDHAPVWNDLAVAYLTRFERTGRPADLVRALSAVERSVSLDPRLSESLFNRALILDSLYLDAAAQEAWNFYLELDPVSGWSQEAQSRLTELISTPARASYRRDRDRLEIRAPRPLSLGRRLLEAGIELYEEQRIDQAYSTLYRAEALLSKAGEPEVREAQYYMALCFYQQADYERALDILEEVAGEATQSASDLSLVGRSLQATGLVRGILGRHAEALSAYQSAADTLLLANDLPRWAGVQVVLAELFDLLGNSEAAWDHRYAALSEARSMDSLGRVRVLAEATSALLQSRDPSVAKYFAEAALAAAVESGSSAALASGHRRLAILAELLGDRRQALAELEEARKEAEKIPDSTVYAITSADNLLARVDTTIPNEPQLALQYLEELRDTFAETNFHLIRPRFFLARARANLAAGRLEASTADYSAALSELEQQVKAAETPSDRAAFVQGTARKVFDEAIAFQLDEREDSREALSLAESAKIASSLGLAADSDAWEISRGPLGLDTIRSRLPPETLVVHFHVLRDRLITWIIGRAGISEVTLNVDANDLFESVAAFRQALAGSDSVEMIVEDSARLFALILGPVWEHIRNARELLIVPDGPLHALPFAALWNGATSQFLVEDHEIIIIPSTSSLLTTRSGFLGDNEASSSARLLVVADPATELDLLRLPRLPGAVQEAAEIARVFPSATVLTGWEATPRRVLDEAGRNQLVHFAGHAVSSATSPLASFLALAPETGPGTGTLFANQIASAPLEGVAIVTLGACQTGSGGEAYGISNISRAFLAAGVGEVLGSLWDVEDRATAAFFEDFYRKLAGGRRPSRALRSAQIEMLRSGLEDLSRPRSWAGFQIVGSGSRR